MFGANILGVIWGGLVLLHHHVVVPPPEPQGYLHGVKGPWVDKPRVLGHKHQLAGPVSDLTTRPSFFDNFDGKHIGWINSALTVSTFGFAHLYYPSRPVYIQKKFIASHPRPVVCSQGEVLFVDGETVTIFNGFHTFVSLMPTNCVTDGAGMTIGALPHFDLPVVEGISGYRLTPDFDINPTFLALCILAVITYAFHVNPISTCLFLSLASVYFASAYLITSVVVMLVAVALYLAWRIRASVIVQQAPGLPFAINSLKDQAKTAMAKPIACVSGEHQQLAWYRRTAERFWMTFLIANGAEKVRDIGGSRSRFPELSHFKHICAADNDNDDILRDAKASNVFENCRLPGQLCPERSKIHFSMFSHVDYHMTVDEILEAAKGSIACIITHKFGPAGTSGGFSPYTIQTGSTAAGKPIQETRYEANWINNGNTITMTTGDGTPYQHGYHMWQNEGAVIGTKSAASYVTIWQNADSRIILMFPATGTYFNNHANVLKTAPKHDMTLRDGTRYTLAIKDNDSCKATVTYHTTPEYTVPAYIPTHVGYLMSSSERNSAYEGQLQSFVTADLNKLSAEFTAAAPVVANHAREISDAYALALVKGRTLSGFNPLTDGKLRALEIEVNHWLQCLPSTCVKILNDVVNHPVVRPLAKRIGITHRVPSYEVFTRVANAEMSTHKGKQRFPNPPSPADAAADGGFAGGPTPVNEQCPGVDRDESAQPSPPAEPVDNWPSLTGQLCQSAGQSPASPVPDQPSGSHRSNGQDLPTPQDWLTTAEREDPALYRNRDAQYSDATPTHDHDDPRPITKAGFSFLRAFEHCAAQGRQLFDAHLSTRRGEGTPQTILSVRLTDGGECVVDEQFTVSRLLLQHEQACLVGLLSNLPRLPLRMLRCAVRTCVRAVGVSMSTCGNYDHSSDCFGIRVLVPSGDGSTSSQYQRTELRGVALEVPRGPTARLGVGKRGVVLMGPLPAGRKSRCLPQVGNVKQDDRPEEYHPESGPAVNGSGTCRQRDRAPASSDRTDHVTKKAYKQRNNHARKRPQPKAKVAGAS
uniref:Chroparavirus methyltransferase domain-containing protein n=1 Tax=Riboviria sp. TaxID=2585031 RepID=A0A8K1WRQ6_9VIRU|nr:MAG: hypothetical protein 1 [Riboviria sp.]